MGGSVSTEEERKNRERFFKEYQLVEDIIDCHYGSVKIFQRIGGEEEISRNSQSFLPGRVVAVKESVYQDIDQMKRELQNIQYLVLSGQRSLSERKTRGLVEVYEYFSICEESLCSSMQKIQIAIEYLQRDISIELKTKKLQNQRFTPHEIFTIAYNCILALNYLQRDGLSHEVLSTSNIMVTEYFQIKLIHPYITQKTPSFASIISQSSHQSQSGIYLSPILTKAVGSASYTPAHNPFKSDVFTLVQIRGGMIFIFRTIILESCSFNLKFLKYWRINKTYEDSIYLNICFDGHSFQSKYMQIIGVILIECCILGYVDNIYDYEIGELKENELKIHLQTIKSSYGVDVHDFIERMVQINEDDRPDFIELEQSLNIENQMNEVFQQQLIMIEQQTAEMLANKNTNQGVSLFQTLVKESGEQKSLVQNSIKSSPLNNNMATQNPQNLQNLTIAERQPANPHNNGRESKQIQTLLQNLGLKRNLLQSPAVISGNPYTPNKPENNQIYSYMQESSNSAQKELLRSSIHNQQNIISPIKVIHLDSKQQQGFQGPPQKPGILKQANPPLLHPEPNQLSARHVSPFELKSNAKQDLNNSQTQQTPDRNNQMQIQNGFLVLNNQAPISHQSPSIVQYQTPQQNPNNFEYVRASQINSSQDNLQGNNQARMQQQVPPQRAYYVVQQQSETLNKDSGLNRGQIQPKVTNSTSNDITSIKQSIINNRLEQEEIQKSIQSLINTNNQQSPPVFIQSQTINTKQPESKDYIVADKVQQIINEIKEQQIQNDQIYKEKERQLHAQMSVQLQNNLKEAENTQNNLQTRSPFNLVQQSQPQQTSPQKQSQLQGQLLNQPNVQPYLAQDSYQYQQQQQLVQQPPQQQQVPQLALQSQHPQNVQLPVYQSLSSSHHPLQQQFASQIQTNQPNLNIQVVKQQQSNCQPFQNQYSSMTSGLKREIEYMPEFSHETYEDQSSYIGEKLDGQRHGMGKFFYSDGGYYIGEWKQGRMDGQGTLYYPSGNIAYIGQWENDQFNGKGIVYNEYPTTIISKPFDFTNFDNLEEYWLKYDGNFKDDNKEGTGQIYLSNGDIFSGNFSNDFVHGQGAYNIKDSKIVSGIWDCNHLVSY